MKEQHEFETMVNNRGDSECDQHQLRVLSSAPAFTEQPVGNQVRDEGTKKSCNLGEIHYTISVGIRVVKAVL